MQRTVKVFLELSSQARDDLLKTIELYGKIYGEYAAWFTAQKSTNKITAHHAVYHSHKKCGLPSALIQSARDNASESIKSYNSRFKKKAWDKVPVYRARSYRLNLRSMSLRGNLLTFSTVGARAKSLVELPEFFIERYPSRVIQAGRVGIDRNGRVFAELIFNIPDAIPSAGKDVVGLDRGILNVIYSSRGVKYGGKSVRRERRKHLYTRGELQKKGTKKAKRRLRQLAGREARFVRQINHEYSKALANDTRVGTYVLEDLSNLAKRKYGYSRKRNKKLSDWSHGQLLEFLIYKCEAKGIQLILVNPAFTSQDCSACGARSQGARRGGLYSCGRCGFTAHADYNAALNIRDRGLEKLSPG